MTLRMHKATQYTWHLHNVYFLPKKKKYTIFVCYVLGLATAVIIGIILGIMIGLALLAVILILNRRWVQ